MATQSLTSTPYKFWYFLLVGAMAVIIITASFLVLGDPRFKAISLLSNFKRFYYATSFMSANVLTVNNFQGSARDGAPSNTLPVLVYHGVIEKEDGSDINLTEDQFKEHMFALKRAGYNAITLEELYSFAHDNKSLPPNPILITFDDGRADSFYLGDPILDAVDYKAAMFVITDIMHDALRGGYYLTSDELLLMLKNGRWEFGSHSANGHGMHKINAAGDEGYFFSNHLWLEDQNRMETEDEFRARIFDDFTRSQKDLGNLIGTKVTSFAFPFGDLGQNQLDAREKSKEIASIAGSVYDMLFYQQKPGQYFTQFSPVLQQGANSFLIRRINMQNTWDADRLLEILEQGSEKKLPYTDTFETDRGWIKVWSDPVIADNVLHLKAGPKSSGASTILDGSQTWKNYEVKVDAISPSQTSLFIWTRFQDDKNNAGCNFGTHFVHVEQTIDGVEGVLKGVERPNNIPAGWFTASARVEGRTLICSINGEEIVRTDFLDPVLTTGGTGFKIWDEVLGKSELEIRQLNVTEIKSEE